MYNKYCLVSFLNVAAADPPQPEDDKDQAGQHEEDHGRQHGAVGQVVDGAAVGLHVHRGVIRSNRHYFGICLSLLI